MNTHTKVTSLHEAVCIMRDTHVPPPPKMLEAIGMTPATIDEGLQIMLKNGASIQELVYAGMAIGYLYAMRQLDANFGLDTPEK